MRRRILIVLISLVVVALTVSYVFERRTRRAEALDRVDLAFDALEDLLFDYGLVMDERFDFTGRELRDVSIALSPRSAAEGRWTVRAEEIRLIELAHDDEHDAPVRLVLEARDVSVGSGGLSVPVGRVDLDYVLADELVEMRRLALTSPILGRVELSFTASELDADPQDWEWKAARLEAKLEKDGRALWGPAADGVCEGLRVWLDDRLDDAPVFAPGDCAAESLQLVLAPPVPTSLDEAADEGSWAAFRDALGLAVEAKRPASRVD